jgi:hypothetical protein
MTAFVTCVGWFVIAMLSLALAAGMICIALWLYEKAMERFEWSVAAKTLQEAGRSIGASAWWFSECPDTSLALRILAERMTNGLAVSDTSNWREQWQKGRRASNCTRSHPHENMSAECERLTEIARANNRAANSAGEPRGEG